MPVHLFVMVNKGSVYKCLQNFYYKGHNSQIGHGAFLHIHQPYFDRTSIETWYSSTRINPNGIENFIYIIYCDVSFYNIIHSFLIMRLSENTFRNYASGNGWDFLLILSIV